MWLKGRYSWKTIHSSLSFTVIGWYRYKVSAAAANRQLCATGLKVPMNFINTYNCYTQSWWNTIIINSPVEAHDIPDSLIINWDQTGVNLLLTVDCTSKCQCANTVSFVLFVPLKDDVQINWVQVSLYLRKLVCK